jgi:hypothetical protein
MNAWVADPREAWRGRPIRRADELQQQFGAGDLHWIRHRDSGRGQPGQRASSTVAARDFRGPRHLAERIGHDFMAGIVFYTGTQTLPFGPRLRAVPVSALWQT